MENLDNFVINGYETIVDAMEKIDINRSGTLFVIDENEQLIGAVTDGDIRRWILKAGELKAEVSVIMNSNPKYIFEGQESVAEEFMKETFIRVLPVLSSSMKVIGIIKVSEMSDANVKNSSSSLSNVPVIIMAGGEGTRLYPYTKILPKPLIPIGDTPIVERIINRFTDYGIKEFYMSVNYKRGMIKSYFGESNHDYSIEYLEESKPLGTAGSIKLCNKVFDRPLFVVNCDTLIIADYDAVYKHHIETGNDITIVSALKKMTIPYGVIHFGIGGRIEGIEEKPKHSYFINTGMYVINPTVIDYVPENKKYHMTDLVDTVIKNKGIVGSYPISEDSFLDMGEFGEMKRMEEKLNIVVD